MKHNMVITAELLEMENLAYQRVQAQKKSIVWKHVAVTEWVMKKNTNS